MIKRRMLREDWQKKAVLCFLLGVGLYAVSVAAAILKSSDIENGFVDRNGWRQGEKSYEFYVDGLGKSEERFQITLDSLKLSEKDTKEMFDRISDTIPEKIKNNNKSLDEVRSNLNLITYVEDYDVRIRWNSEKPELINSFGEVVSNQISERGEACLLYAEFTDGVVSSRYQWKIVLYPQYQTEEENQKQEFLKFIKEEDQKQNTETRFYLPQSFRGKELKYREKSVYGTPEFLVLGLVMVLFCYFSNKSQLQETKKNRNDQLLIDYSEIVSELLIYIGAGMTIRLAWEKIVNDYHHMIKEKRKEKRYAYEEMSKSLGKLQSGSNEGEVYKEFGIACGVLQYMKLAALLEQNRKNGSKNLRSLLEIEMEDAFEDRKNIAKRLGEEAGTKLLFPLFLMLSIVMIIIMVPAMMNFM